MQLAKFPRGREHARAIDAAPIPDPHGPGHDDADEHQVEDENPAAVEWIGWKVTDELGRTVGRVEGTTGAEWLVVRDRRRRHVLAPAGEAIAGGTYVFLPYDSDLIAAAPQLPEGAERDKGTEDAAREHYELG